MKRKKLSSRIVYKNPWLNVTEDKVIRPDGKEGVYGIINPGSGVRIIVVDDDGYIYFLNEYRYPIKKNILELPGGGFDGKASLETAKQELQEETGIVAKKFKLLGSFYHIPGFCSSYEDVWLATELDLENLSVQSEDDSVVNEIIKIHKDKILNMIKNGKIESGLTLGALQIYFASL